LLRYADSGAHGDSSGQFGDGLAWQSKRAVTDEDQASIDRYAKRYVEYKDIYRQEVAEGQATDGLL